MVGLTTRWLTPCSTTGGDENECREFPTDVVVVVVLCSADEDTESPPITLCCGPSFDWLRIFSGSSSKSIRGSSSNTEAAKELCKLLEALLILSEVLLALIASCWCLHTRRREEEKKRRREDTHTHATYTHTHTHTYTHTHTHTHTHTYTHTHTHTHTQTHTHTHKHTHTHTHTHVHTHTQTHTHTHTHYTHTIH